MIELILGAALIVSIVLGHIERGAHATERQRLTAAAFARVPQNAAQLLAPAPQPAEPREPRPIPLGL